MPQLLVGFNQDLDIRDISISGLLSATVDSHSSTQLVLNLLGEVITFKGFGFTYDNFGTPMGGTVTSLQDVYQGNLIFQIDDMSVPVTQWVAWANTDDTIGAFRTVLSGDDLVVGNMGADTLGSFAGNDNMSGSGGSDWLEGGSGNDTVFGGLDNDTLVETSGSNYLRGDEGNDNINGGSGFDDINGNMGNDTAHGGKGDDWVVGGKDNDVLYGDEGGDVVLGNLGDDTLVGDVDFMGVAGNDIIRGGQGNDIIYGDAHIANPYPGGANWLSGDRGDDTISGGSGPDIFHSFSGAGLDEVWGFDASQGDRILLDPGTSYTISYVNPDTTKDTLIDMGGGDRMLIHGAHVEASSIFVAWAI